MLAAPTFRIRYSTRSSSGAIEADPAQAQSPSMRWRRSTSGWPAIGRPRRHGLFSRLFGDRDAGPPRGLYIHGKVGRGKTMLMDMFFESEPVSHKRRAHFHEFMADVHERIHGFRQKIARGELPTAT